MAFAGSCTFSEYFPSSYPVNSLQFDPVAYLLAEVLYEDRLNDASFGVMLT